MSGFKSFLRWQSQIGTRLSGEETIRLLGPFVVNAVDNNLTEEGVLIHTFDSEAYLYDIVVHTVSAFDGDASSVEVVLPVVGSIISIDAATSPAAGKSALVVTGECPRRVTGGETVHVICDGTPTVGQAVVYLIYAPAA